jgi:hypothetical protein
MFSPSFLSPFYFPVFADAIGHSVKHHFSKTAKESFQSRHRYDRRGGKNLFALFQLTGENKFYDDGPTFRYTQVIYLQSPAG